jgi:hypothetical protein
MFATVITRIINQLRFASRPANNVPPGQSIRRALIGVAANSSNPIAVVMPGASAGHYALVDAQIAMDGTRGSEHKREHDAINRPRDEPAK